MGRGCILIYDYGTTALKTILFDSELNVLDRITTELNYEYPAPMQVEMEGDLYWDLVKASTMAILDRNNCRGSLRIISVTSQAETVIPVDRDGNCLRKAMVWLDNRSVAENEHLKGCFDRDTFFNATGLGEFDPILPINKLAWIRNNEPDIYEKTCKFLLLKDFILFRLTGGFVSDPSICSCSGCFDINCRDWWAPALAAAGLDREKLPEIRDSGHIIGSVKKDVRKLLGLPADVIVVNGLLDQCGSALGAGNMVPGILTETTGTAIVVATTAENGRKLERKGNIQVLCHGIPGSMLVISYCSVAGILMKWFKDNFCELETLRAEREGLNPYSLLDALVDEDSPVNPRLVLLPHFCGSMLPVNNPSASGILFGLDLNTGKGDVVRTIMESVAFLLKDNVSLLAESGFPVNEVISLGGGARSPVWLKIKSQVLNKRIITLENEESTAFGCAFLAGLAGGFFGDYGDIKGMIAAKGDYLPEGTKVADYEKKYDLYNRLYWANEQLFNYIK